MIYQQILLFDSSTIGDPGPLPAALQGLADVSLADLSFAADYVGTGFWPVDVAPADPEQYTDVIGSISVFPLTHRCSGAYLPRPTGERKAALVVLISTLRATHALGPFATPAGPFPCDDAHQTKVGNAVMYLGLAPSVTSIDWESSPGVYATITAAQVKNVGLLMGAYLVACTTQAKALTAAVAAAVTNADLDAIDLINGWPT